MGRETWGRKRFAAVPQGGLRNAHLLWLRHPDVFPSTRKKMAGLVPEKHRGHPRNNETQDRCLPPPRQAALMPKGRRHTCERGASHAGGKRAGWTVGIVSRKATAAVAGFVDRGRACAALQAPHRGGIVWPQGRSHDHDVQARSEPRWEGRSQPCRCPHSPAR